MFLPMFVNLSVNKKLYKLNEYTVPMHVFLHIMLAFKLKGEKKTLGEWKKCSKTLEWYSKRLAEMWLATQSY